MIVKPNKKKKKLVLLMETHTLDLQKKLEMPWLLASQLALALASQRASAPSHWIEGKILTGNHGFPP
jgi:hypothetical protein